MSPDTPREPMAARTDSLFQAIGPRRLAFASAAYALVAIAITLANPWLGAAMAGAVLLALAAFLIPPSLELVAIVYAFAFFVPLAKPLTGLRELMLLPELVLYPIALRCLLGFHRRRLSGPAVLGFGCFLCFYLLAAAELANPNLPSPRIALEGFRKTALTSVSFVLGIALVGRATDPARFTRWILFAGCIVGAYAVKQVFWRGAIDDQIIETNAAGYWTWTGLGGAMRSSGTLSGPFHLGMMGVQVFCLGVFTAASSRGRPWLKTLSLAAMLCGAAAVLTSQTRTNYLALAFLGGFALMLVQPSAKRLLALQGFGLIAAVACAVVLAREQTSVFEDSIAALANPWADARFAGRFEQYGPILQSIANQPWIGHGMGSAGDALDHAFAPPAVHHNSHNLALKLALEMGLAGPLLFAGVVAAWLIAFCSALAHKIARPEAWHAQLLFAALIAPVLFNGLTGSGIEAYPTNHLMWFGLGAALGATSAWSPEPASAA